MSACQSGAAQRGSANPRAYSISLQHAAAAVFGISVTDSDRRDDSKAIKKESRELRA